MPNETAPMFSASALENMMFRFWLYVGEGVILALTNLTILFAITFQKLLRKKKEYIIVAGLAFADGFFGLTVVIAGLGRNVMIASGRANDLVSRWSCILTPWNMLLLFFENMGVLMLFVVSIDRLLAVTAPLKYFTFTSRYAYRLVGSVVVYQFINWLVAVVVGYTQFQHPEKAAICYSSYAMSPKYYVYFSQLSLTAGLGSVVLYVIVYIIFMSKHKVAASHNATAAERHARAQRRLTTTLAISCFFTFVLYVCPIVVRFVAQSGLDLNPKLMSPIIQWSFVISNLNPILNIFIYATRHKDLRLAIKCLLGCKRITKSMLDRIGVEHTETRTAKRNTTGVGTKQKDAAV